MTLRPEYSLGHSAYNGFLFGSLGEDATGTEITVLSALTRLGIDPWQEAERLAALPRADAVQALTATLARLPEGTCTGTATGSGDEMAKTAVRLVALLPEGAVAAIPQTAEARVASLEAAVRSERVGAKARKNAGATAKHSTRPNALPPKARLVTWLTWGALAIAFYLLLVMFTPDRNLESSDIGRIESRE